ncbi:MAG: signal recognition particle subunit SRP19/SEC65 family protein [Thermoplasmata archaeon]
MPDHFYVYPAYLSKDLPRALGRRIPVGGALAEVTAEEIVQAARALGFKAEVEAGKQYPRQFYTYAGRVKVVKKSGITKGRFLAQLAQEIRRHRPVVVGKQ